MRPPLLRRLAGFIQTNSARVLLALTLSLALLCVAIKSAKLDAELSSWIQRTARVDSELQLVSSAVGEGAGSTSQLLLQTPKSQNANVLTVEAFMIHLEAMAIATHVTVELFDVSWSLKDICFTPTIPDFDGMPISIMLENMMPCAIKTPLDCFWEGAKLLGPEHPVSVSSIAPKFKWTNLDPTLMVERIQRSHPHASFPYATFTDWMRRVGIGSGYTDKPCLDPTDPNCPDSAPNKFSGEPPNIGLRLTGGCHGLAANQMHWKEEEIVGGVVRNRSGHIIKASALQSTIQLMGEQDMYDYWRKTSKVQDINNWSADKAKFILDTWQKRYKEELAQFTRTSTSSSSQRIHAMTSKSMFEPIDDYSLLDVFNFQSCLVLMTIISCVTFPTFTFPVKQGSFKSSKEKSYSEDDKFTVSRFKTTMLALVTSSFVGLVFIASLGLSSFMNLPFNMATTQILPPLALLYGFNQFMTVANIYSQKCQTVSSHDLTANSLEESIPVITIDSLSNIIALTVSTIIPVTATRVLAFQAITYLTIIAFAAILVMPSIIVTFLKYQSPIFDPRFDHNEVNERSARNLGLRNKKPDATGNVSSIEEQLFSRIQDDLKNIRADTDCRPTGIDFSAQIGADGIQTSFKVSTSMIPKGHQNASVNKTTRQTNPPATKGEPARLPELDTNQKMASNLLPDLVAGAIPRDATENVQSSVEFCTAGQDSVTKEMKPDTCEKSSRIARIICETLTKNKKLQCSLLLLKLIASVAVLTHFSQVRYGLQLRDIIARGTTEYESFLIQEKHFPIYNIFAVTKGNIDYPTNQKLLHEFYSAFNHADAIVRDDDASYPKFWLINFRDWLLEIQRKFDNEKNQTAITGEGWSPETSDTAKLAYKLLAQTGRPDNPVDKGLVDFNRLVDTNGIINPKAFYYYLAAWVAKDPFTYATSEANFKPEPKVWNDNPDDLKIERARPLNYAQIPFLMKLPSNQDCSKTISQIRSISQAFEQLNLPNFPTGIPFIFWDQFLNLDIQFFVAIALSAGLIFIVIGLITSDFRVAAIITVPILLTILEVYSFMGYMSIPFNNILAVLLVGTLATAIVQTVHYLSVSSKIISI